jgi:ribose transport system permease protein
MRNAPILGPLGALVFLFLTFSALAPGSFLTSANMFNILAQVSVLAVMATGITCVLLLGEIDLGFANVAVFAGMAASLFFAGKAVGVPLVGKVNFLWLADAGVLSIAVAVVFALLLGLLSGTLTARLGVPSFIATLGVLLLAQGWSFYWSQGENVYSLIPLAKSLGAGFMGPVPKIAISAGVVMLVGYVVLSRTRFGRYVYMTGANRTAAELAGVPTRRVVIAVFALSGLLAGFAGVLNVGRLGSAQAGAGDELLLPALAAVVLGGTSLFGGRGGVHYTLVGLLIYGVLDNGLDQLALDIYLKPFVRGVLLLLAIVFNVVMLRLASQATLQAVTVEEETVGNARPGASADGERTTAKRGGE